MKKNTLSEEMRYAVDIPDLYDNEGWINVNYFATKREAIKFIKEKFGGDDKGRINLISAL